MYRKFSITDQGLYLPHWQREPGPYLAYNTDRLISQLMQTQNYFHVYLST